MKGQGSRNGMRMWAGLGVCLFLLVWRAGARADLTFPAVFEIVEETPNTLRLSLTVPLVKGRYLNVKPLVPDSLRADGKVEARAGTGSLTRTWQVEADPASLYGEAFGLDGLLGTSQEVRFSLTTLDGRKHETVLRSTRPIFFIPSPPESVELAATAARDGLRHAARHVGLWSLVTCVLLSGMSVRRRIWTTLAVSSVFLLCWSLLVALPSAGLSDAEVRLMTGFRIAGLAVGAGLAVAVLGLLRSLMPAALRRPLFSIAFVIGSAWAFYEGAGLVLRYGPLWLAWIENIFARLFHLWFSPFAADWAMAKLRIPLLSMAVLVFLVLGFARIKRAPVRFAAAGCLLIMALALLPYGVSRASVPFLSPDVPSPHQARQIIEPMLSEIYYALNLKDESQTYDRLAQQVAGDLVTDLYLDSRRRLVAGTREGASVLVKQVTLQDIDAPLAVGEENPVYFCRWIVTAKVTHWQHIHQRRNIYEGDLRLAVENDRWKLSALNLHSEEREVVQGSFVSR